MKTVVVILEAGLQEERADLDGRTPYETARCEHGEALARQGRRGHLAPPREPYAWESLLATLAGASTARAAAVRPGPLGAAALDRAMKDFAFAYCADLVTLDDETVIQAPATGVTWKETGALADDLAKACREGVRLAPLAPGRFILALPGRGGEWPEGLPLWYATGETAESALPAGRKARALRTLRDSLQAVLRNHAINEVRIDLDQNPANGLWLWGGGGPGSLPAAPRNAVREAWWCDEPLVLGLGRRRGARVSGPAVDMPGREDPDPVFPPGFAEVLRTADRAFLYYRAGGVPEHMAGGDRVRRLERFDHQIMQPLRGWAGSHPESRILQVLMAGPRDLATAHRARMPFILAEPCGRSVPADAGDVLPADLSAWLGEG